MLRRWAVDPTAFGSNEGYSWVDYATTDCPPAHIDYTSFLPVRSWRLWDPYRTAYRDTGVTNQLFVNVANGGTTPEPVFDPKPAHWKGMKGDLLMAIPPIPEEWPTACEDGTTFLSAIQSLLQDGSPVTLTGVETYLYVPVFFAVMKGKYQEVLGPLATGNMGFEIDSGPEDDPAVVSGLDITNPSTLESWRVLSWWSELQRIPWSYSRYPVYNGASEQVQNFSAYNAIGPTRRIPVNLESNHRLDRNEVLWLVCQTGTVQVPFWGGAGGGLSGLTFTGWPLITEMHATAMVQVLGE